MPEPSLILLLDQNIPVAVARWLRGLQPDWTVNHVTEVGLWGKPDADIYRWAQRHQAVVITYDEDFADARQYPLGRHHGIIRLRVWPTTIEQTQDAIQRLLKHAPIDQWHNSLIIIDNQKIRIRKPVLD